jgi:hypothetical protein
MSDIADQESPTTVLLRLLRESYDLIGNLESHNRKLHEASASVLKCLEGSEDWPRRGRKAAVALATNQLREITKAQPPVTDRGPFARFLSENGMLDDGQRAATDNPSVMH